MQCVIFMTLTKYITDSNRQYIQAGKFWKQGTIIKKKTSTARELVEIINKSDLSKTEHIIISTGTNDTEASSAAEIVSNIVD